MTRPTMKTKLIAIQLVAIFLAFGCCDPAHSQESQASQTSLESLLKTEKKIQSAVSKVMESVVAVTDNGGAGSGVVISSDGLILTAGHVMASRSGDFEILFPSGRTARARALGRNLNVDAGMIQIIDPGPWPHVDVARQLPAIGDWVVSLGHSGGYEVGRKPPVRTGRVLENRGHQFVTDAVLIGGDSGGPLFNLDGELVAIHSSIGDTIAENRHVKITTFKQHWTRLRRGDQWGKLPELDGDEEAKPTRPVRAKARMGIVVDRSATRARINKVHPNSPAQRVGIQAGDVVTEFDRVQITSSTQLINLIKNKRPGQAYWVEINRNNAYRFRAQVILEQFGQ